MEDFILPVILGIVEGLTEFLPVSSTGHLIITGHMLGFTGEKAASFEVAIQLGAILSVVFLYWHRFLRLVPVGGDQTLLPQSTLSGWNGLWRIGIACLPALAVGYFARHFIKAHLFTPETVTAALAVGGVAILIAERTTKKESTSLDQLSVAQAVGIGLFQVLALWPGTSRSAATIVGGMLLGLDRKSAAEFSFLIAVPVMIIATGYELLKMQEALAFQDAVHFAIGFVVSFVVALIAVKGFVAFLGRGSLAPFAWYRIIVSPIFYLLTRSGGL